jgi:hypothetical protein
MQTPRFLNLSPQVRSLRLLAVTRFFRLAENLWHEAGYLPDIVDHVYDNTAETETMLRGCLVRLVGTAVLHNGDVVKEMEGAIQRHGDFGFKVLQYVLDNPLASFLGERCFPRSAAPASSRAIPATVTLVASPDRVLDHEQQRTAPRHQIVIAFPSKT